MSSSLTRRNAVLAVAGATALPFLRPLAAQAQSVTPQAARALGKDAYVYGFPLVDLYRIEWGYFADTGGPAFKTPVNTLFNTARVYTPADTTIQTPNSDTPYSFALLDLRAEPWIVTLPKIEAGRYYSVQFVDQYTYNSFYLGTRTTGNGGGDFLIAGPGWNGTAPAKVKEVFRADTDLMVALFRTQLFGASDLDNVEKVQAGYKIAPLSAYAGTPTPAAAPPIRWVPPLSPEQERTSLDFFSILAWVLQYCPVFPDEVALRQRLAGIGVVPGKPFDPGALPAATRDALAAGMADGQKEIDAKRAAILSASGLFGSRKELGTDYLDRAVGAQYGILGNTAAEAIYLGYTKGEDGQPLSGAHTYTVRFAPAELPPVNAFWSLTMYGLPKQLLVANPIDRYLVNSPMLPGMKKDPDGGYTIYVQTASPGRDKESNWLPAPAGPFFIIVRAYYPKQSLLDGTWKLPPIQQTS